MPLTIAERKHRMPHGAQRAVAAQFGVSEAYVSVIMNEQAMPKTAVSLEKVQRIQAALAARLALPVEDVFPDVQEEAAPVTASASS